LVDEDERRGSNGLAQAAADSAKAMSKNAVNSKEYAKEALAAHKNVVRWWGKNERPKGSVVAFFIKVA
jgi:uncharacterized protein with gpF-like domain